MRWTEEELRLVKINAKPPNRSINGFRAKRTRMGLRQKREARPRWTDEQIDKLKKLAG